MLMLMMMILFLFASSSNDRDDLDFPKFLCVILPRAFWVLLGLGLIHQSSVITHHFGAFINSILLDNKDVLVN
jgi:hypothetical protein